MFTREVSPLERLENLVSNTDFSTAADGAETEKLVTDTIAFLAISLASLSLVFISYSLLVLIGAQV